MRYLIFVTFVIMATICHSALGARYFEGNGSLDLHVPTETRLAICTPNEKYNFEAGKNYSIRLYVRNDMDNKSVRRVYVVPEADSRIKFTFNPPYLEDIAATEYKYFDIDVKIPKDMPNGNYRVEFLAGTEEYMEGSFTDEVLIRVLPYSDSLQWFFLIISIIVTIAFIYRFFLFKRVNRRSGKHRRKIT
jgi:uncharacterized membrane protein